MTALDRAAHQGTGPVGTWPATAPVVVLHRASRSAAPLRALGVIGLLLALPVVALLTLWPSHLLLRVKPRVLSGLEWLHAREMFEWLYWTRLEVLANVAMFVPLALLLAFVLGARRWWVALGLSVAATVGIELTQHFMPGRVASVQDIVANSLGAVIGVVLAVSIEGVVRAARRRSHRTLVH
ncbi:VanZ family protein [Agrococcus sp. ARC_14]|uniref:VanZ family protein n=1 Tax=Agrococcus sp. ARC_14 TaxID=2919927 RepID=UPI001F05C9C1|nr:VanZ family protein [Agrococcus sp. ARC_14]MCH1884312.1 VanZ family protein [Agrococcus sp. ARC_14]